MGRGRSRCNVADLIPGERSAIDDEKRERTLCFGVALDDATEPVRLRELPGVLGLLNVSNAEPLADALAQELEQVLGVGLEIAEDREPIAAFPIAIPDLTRVHGVSANSSFSSIAVTVLPTRTTKSTSWLRSRQ